jgi:lysophospholipid acyltransferase (LPLAT)-like uncharacterized protein
VPGKPAFVNAVPNFRLAFGPDWAKTPCLTSPSETSSAEAGAVHGLTGWRRAAVWPLTLLVRLWGRTLRFELSQEDRAVLEKKDESVAFVLWHNRLFVTPEVNRRYRQGRQLYCLVSASRDGAWLAAFFENVGMKTVRGSSSRLGREAASGLVSVLREGHDIGITPDGPRGPMYELKPGALIVPRRAQVPVLLLGAEFTRAFRLGSWDRFYLPMPFSRVRLLCRTFDLGSFPERDEAARQMSARLAQINRDRP